MNLVQLQKDLRKKGHEEIEASRKNDSVLLEGTVANWNKKIETGWLASRYGFKAVVNDIQVTGVAEEALLPPYENDDSISGLYYDAVIIGGGIIGCAIARELSKYSISVALLEKESDVAFHTSSRNDGMIHDGFAAKPGTKKALYNVRGNRMWEPLAKEIGIDFRRTGSLVLFDSPLIKSIYPIMAARAKKNSVDGWEFWSKKRVIREEMHITDAQHGAFFLPSAGILSPYKATAALAESAIANGASIHLETCVTAIRKERNKISSVVTNRGVLRAGVVVNASGNWADVVAEMAGDRFFSLHQRRGVDMILDTRTGPYLNHILGMPNLLQTHSNTKGGGLIPTTEGNILVGPTATEAPGREDYRTSASEIQELEKHLALNKKLSLSQVITYFAGIRPCTYEEDFIVEQSRSVANLVHASGIQSPGLASAPSIAEDIAQMTIQILEREIRVVPKENFISTRTPVLRLCALVPEARSAQIAANPSYGRIVCRCEEVSEGEVCDALDSPLGINSLDAVKRRTRAGMGRCHGGFCTPRVMEIIAAEKKVELGAVTKKGPGSKILFSETKLGAIGGDRR